MDQEINNTSATDLIGTDQDPFSELLVELKLTPDEILTLAAACSIVRDHCQTDEVGKLYDNIRNKILEVVHRAIQR